MGFGHTSGDKIASQAQVVIQRWRVYCGLKDRLSRATGPAVRLAEVR